MTNKISSQPSIASISPAPNTKPNWVLIAAAVAAVAASAIFVSAKAALFVGTLSLVTYKALQSCRVSSGSVSPIIIANNPLAPTRPQLAASPHPAVQPQSLKGMQTTPDKQLTLDTSAQVQAPQYNNQTRNTRNASKQPQLFPSAGTELQPQPKPFPAVPISQPKPNGSKGSNDFYSYSDEESEPTNNAQKQGLTEEDQSEQMQDILNVIVQFNDVAADSPYFTDDLYPIVIAALQKRHQFQNTFLNLGNNLPAPWIRRSIAGNKFYMQLPSYITIHNNYHYVLAEIDWDRRKLNVFNSMSKYPMQGILDNYINPLRAGIKEQANIELTIQEQSFDHQKDGTSCGFWVMHYALSRIQQPNSSLGPMAPQFIQRIASIIRDELKRKLNPERIGLLQQNEQTISLLEAYNSKIKEFDEILKRKFKISST